jgi:hypothetical protein
MNFSLALEILKDDGKIARKSWNASPSDETCIKGYLQFIYLVPGSIFEVNRPPLNEIYPEGTKIIYRSHIDFRDHNGTCGVWSPSNDDVLAEDWETIE